MQTLTLQIQSKTLRVKYECVQSEVMNSNNNSERVDSAAAEIIVLVIFAIKLVLINEKKKKVGIFLQHVKIT